MLYLVFKKLWECTLYIRYIFGNHIYIFLTVCALSFHFLNGVFRSRKVWNFDVVNLSVFSFITWALGIVSKKSLCRSALFENQPAPIAHWSVCLGHLCTSIITDLHHHPSWLWFLERGEERKETSGTDNSVHPRGTPTFIWDHLVPGTSSVVCVKSFIRLSTVSQHFML